MTNVLVWAWNQKPWCPDVQRHMHHGKDAEVKSRQLSLLSPASWEARVTNDLCKKRTFVYKSALFLLLPVNSLLQLSENHAMLRHMEKEQFIHRIVELIR